MTKKSGSIITILVIACFVVFGLTVTGCEKPQPKQAEAPKQEPAAAPQAGQQPAAPAQAAPQAPSVPPAQLGKGSTDAAAQAAIPVDAKLNMQQGMNYMRARDYDNAIKELTVAIQKHPTYDVAYSNRAVAYMQQRKFNKAHDDLKKGVEINPNNATLHYNFIALYSLENHLDRALDSLDRALELGFNNYDALRDDPDLENVRRHPEFRKICEKYKVFIQRRR
ncbi:MAG TPA: tetratricopeptide repeat protein [Thermodesulfovibrionales bacterium]|nr:tetratricopeptide repeat protein [Thermodesulfovibrionales bacterium]